MKEYRIDFHSGKTQTSRFWLNARSPFVALVLGYLRGRRHAGPFRSICITLERAA